MKKLFDCIVLTALIVFLALVFRSSIGEGETLSDDFEDANPVLDWSTDQTTTAPNGQAFLGPFGAESVTLLIEPPAGYHFVIVDWDVYAIGDWGTGSIPWYAWQVAGSNEDVEHLLAASYLSNYIGRTETNTLGYAEPDRVYHFRQPLVGDGEEWYRVEFEGVGPDVSWGIDNVQVAIETPEPSTGKTLWIVGLMLFMGFCWLKIWRIGRKSGDS